MITLSSADIYFALALQGLFTGLGSALGAYLANKHIIERVNKLTNAIKSKEIKDGH